MEGLCLSCREPKDDDGQLLCPDCEPSRQDVTVEPASAGGAGPPTKSTTIAYGRGPKNGARLEARWVRGYWHGDSRSYATMERVIDRDAKTYRKDVINPDSGEVLYTKPSDDLTDPDNHGPASHRPPPALPEDAAQIWLWSSVPYLGRTVWNAECPTDSGHLLGSPGCIETYLRRS
jgi:hypothetical protein